MTLLSCVKTVITLGVSVGRRLDRVVSAKRLKEAFDWANSDKPVPKRWMDLAWRLDEAPSKTLTPALGTALLAKAVDPFVDALAMKESYSENAYSIRNLAHSVLVPASVEYGFSLRTTGREPINNQPFYRYDHMNLIERSRAGVYLDELRAGLRELNGASGDEALAALAAFLRVRIEASKNTLSLTLPDLEVPFDRLVDVVAQFLAENVDRPKRTQALVCAAFDIIYTYVATHTRRLNDPSRDFPGDVQAYVNQKVIMSAEVRGKPVPATEVQSFVKALRRKAISRGFVVVLDDRHSRLPGAELMEWAWTTHRVYLTIIESTSELLHAMLAWSSMAVEEALRTFPNKVAQRLDEIEASVTSQTEWSRLVTCDVGIREMRGSE